MSVRVLIVDDHQIVRQGLKMLIESRPDLIVAGEAADGVEGVRKAEELLPDAVILDVSMPNMNGLTAARAIRKSVPGTKILMLTQHAVPQMRAEARDAGANGYLLKSHAAKDLFAAIDALMRGEHFWGGSTP
jgi:DNA-binding NarL/FixJ family response regulator